MDSYPKKASKLSVPKITIVEDPQAEVEMFYDSLHNQDHPFMRFSLPQVRDCLFGFLQAVLFPGILPKG